MMRRYCAIIGVSCVSLPMAPNVSAKKIFGRKKIFGGAPKIEIKTGNDKIFPLNIYNDQTFLFFPKVFAAVF